MLLKLVNFYFLCYLNMYSGVNNNYSQENYFICNFVYIVDFHIFKD